MIRPKIPKLSLPGGLRGFVVCVCLAIVGIDAFVTWHAHGVAVWVARRETENLAESLAQQAADTMETADGALQSLVERVERTGDGPGVAPELQASMAATVVTMPRLHELLLIDTHGTIVLDNTSAKGDPTLRFTEREYFRYHRDNPSRLSYISGPVRSKREDRWTMLVSRRIERADGRFAGVAVAQISLDYFDQTYSGVDIGKFGVIELVRDNGTVVVHHPFVASFIGRSFVTSPPFTGPMRYEPAGSATGVSPLDGVRRLYAFRRLDRFPLVVIVALSEAEVFASWQTEALENGLVTLAIEALFALLGEVLTKQMDQRRSAERALARLALIDGLTGIANRRQFDDTFERIWLAAKRNASTVSLLMIDADRFKEYNDSYGHVAGDAVLQAIAAGAANAVRPGDVCARYGGEEFCVILPAADGAVAIEVAERIRVAIRTRHIPHRAGEAGVVTVSIGVATGRPHDGDDRTALLAAADRALYDAKRAGRAASPQHRSWPANAIVMPAGCGTIGSRTTRTGNARAARARDYHATTKYVLHRTIRRRHHESNACSLPNPVISSWEEPHDDSPRFRNVVRPRRAPQNCAVCLRRSRREPWRRWARTADV